MKVVVKTEISAYPLLSRGKVRDIYDVDEKNLLIVTTDRMSAFDVIMNEPIPYKGVILNQITLFWMEKFKDIIPNHLVESDVNRFPAALAPWKDELEGRAVIVRKAKPLPVECIVRGYITGSGWKDYKATGSVCGYKLPANLRESDKLEPALFTPSTKAELGKHDENISVAQAAELLGAETAAQVERTTLAIYEAGRTYAAGRGIIVADTKFEFGFIDGKLHVFDQDWPELPFAHREHIGCTVDYVAGRNRYMGYLISLGIYSFKGIKVGLDCANGASWNIAKSVFDALGADTYVINNQPNGLNINLNAGSTHIEGLQKFVVEKGLDVGFAYDGDADRCLCVDEKGNVITGDHILYIYGCYMKERGKLLTNTVVTTVMSNFGLYKAFDEQGIGYAKKVIDGEEEQNEKHQIRKGIKKFLP